MEDYKNVLKQIRTNFLRQTTKLIPIHISGTIQKIYKQK